jgi:hypothetical protein
MQNPRKGWKMLAVMKQFKKTSSKFFDFHALANEEGCPTGIVWIIEYMRKS